MDTNKLLENESSIRILDGHKQIIIKLKLTINTRWTKTHYTIQLFLNFSNLETPNLIF